MGTIPGHFKSKPTMFFCYVSIIIVYCDNYHSIDRSALRRVCTCPGSLIPNCDLAVVNSGSRQLQDAIRQQREQLEYLQR